MTVIQLFVHEDMMHVVLWLVHRWKVCIDYEWIVHSLFVFSFKGFQATISAPHMVSNCRNV